MVPSNRDRRPEPAALGVVHPFVDRLPPTAAGRSGSGPRTQSHLAGDRPIIVRHGAVNESLRRARCPTCPPHPRPAGRGPPRSSTDRAWCRRGHVMLAGNRLPSRRRPLRTRSIPRATSFPVVIRSSTPARALPRFAKPTSTLGASSPKPGWSSPHAWFSPRSCSAFGRLLPSGNGAPAVSPSLALELSSRANTWVRSRRADDERGPSPASEQPLVDLGTFQHPHAAVVLVPNDGDADEQTPADRNGCVRSRSRRPRRRWTPGQCRPRRVSARSPGRCGLSPSRTGVLALCVRGSRQRARGRRW
jgi:hypothetical protein